MKVNFIDSDGTAYGSDISSSEVVTKKAFTSDKKSKNELPVAKFVDGIEESEPEKILVPSTTKEKFSENIPTPKLTPIDDDDEDDEENVDQVSEQSSEASTDSEKQNQTDAESVQDETQNETPEKSALYNIAEHQTQIEGFESEVYKSGDQYTEENTGVPGEKEVSESETSAPSDLDNVSESDSEENQEDDSETVTSVHGVIRYRDSAGRFTSKDNDGAKASIAFYSRSEKVPVPKENNDNPNEPTPTVKRMTSAKAEDRKKLGNMKKDKKSIKRIPQ